MCMCVYVSINTLITFGNHYYNNYNYNNNNNNNKLQLKQYESKATTSTQSGKVISIHTHTHISLSFVRPLASIVHHATPRPSAANREIDLIITCSRSPPLSNTININLFIDQIELSSTRENDIKHKKKKPNYL